MTRPRAILGAITAPALLAILLYLLFRPQSPKTAVLLNEHQTSSPPHALLLDSSPERGHQLAQGYCQTCHLFPDPALLDKATWENGALPEMAPWLGRAKPKL